MSYATGEEDRMKRIVVMVAMLFALCSLAGIIASSCGGDGGGCPGIVCSDCGASGDCDVTCSGDDVEYCGNFGYFDDLSLRCAFCAPEDYQI
jgi:hypothetical protein